ncbi:hypothetical protein [Limnoglobus roseus]|uniref:Uncharacterized protein n=1 Tax=Limnoglobus roseus TaxID=2598579 RepID=A0A5C1AL91_9BACT|nr:hypothetical protein [Limnoglobus roseus]QEL18502.1 hypothetical protein PX52LOC_05528 [Limnoglobus roseus]
MSTPTWVRVTSSPASGPASPPTPGQAIRNDDSRLIPWSPGELDLVWFLGDIYQVQTHFGSRNTVPCVGDECALCASQPPRPNGFAAVLVRNGQSLEGVEVWIPRVLRVFKNNFGLGDNLRGRVFKVKKLTGSGARSEWQYTFSYAKTPPVDEFDVQAVMNSVWFPAKFPPVYLGEQRVALKPKAVAPAEPTFAESLKALPNEQLIGMISSYRDSGMNKLADAIAAELRGRGVTLDTDPSPTGGDGDGTAKLKAGRFRIGVYSVPVKAGETAAEPTNGRHGKPAKGGAL